MTITGLPRKSFKLIFFPVMVVKVTRGVDVKSLLKPIQSAVEISSRNTKPAIRFLSVIGLI
ncbi:hypothetical protein METHB2_10181 [Candidatus Methylobacter favarea]|uniref:Uncharacterized protein n=1 Tax=Candidatus Methylobacter favarea TaxID=2707345 RepID=A0A8S0XH11_9GAMM|nr:hypothetical protein METHB2_10181 [Candidatus Methylobacter favarea]